MDTKIEQKIKLLEEKYALMGQDLDGYLDGLLLSNYLTYWDYTQVDTLLTLQNPKTDFPDEMIFIMYHQITELYFKLCLHEYDQISNNAPDILPNGQLLGWKTKLDPIFFAERVMRINRYFEALTKSFEIMINGMEKEQFLRYRMALLPASGFQSAQYRMIEIASTDFINLVDKDVRANYAGKNASIEDMFQNIYWNKGATELASGKKTLTLKQFEKKYSDKFIAMANDHKSKNLWAKYKALSTEDQKNQNIINALKNLDVNVNINWPLVHYKSAVRYLQANTEDIAATGGTNWQKYLPPRFQKRVFYPELWTKEELENWGKSWVETNVFQVK
ncbi:MAG TPA: tryptophan 2,3-dioxygenase family protein [Bacteroidia bacterium]|jgi:tryptophan 2,3-dioxygenase|nr:tryptophan 2,3-dioxygenase family protein [Bacteroidia bacterium]